MSSSASFDPYLAFAIAASSQAADATRNRTPSSVFSSDSMAPRPLNPSSFPEAPIPPSLRDSPYLNSPHSIFRSVYSPQRPSDERWLMDTVPMGSPHAVDDMRLGVGINGQVHSSHNSATGPGGRARSDSRAPQWPIQSSNMTHTESINKGRNGQNVVYVAPPRIEAGRRGSLQNNPTHVAMNPQYATVPCSQMGPTSNVVPPNAHSRSSVKQKRAPPPSSYNLDLQWPNGRHMRSVSAPDTNAQRTPR